MMIILALALFCSVDALSTTLSRVDQYRISGQLKQEHADLKSVYYAVTALNSLKKENSFAQSHCGVALKTFNAESILDVFQVSEITKILKCKNVPKINIQALLDKTTDSVSFSRGIISMVNLGYPVSKELVAKFVTIGKENDSPSGGAALFYAASVLPKSDELIPVVGMVEDILAQADELNGEYLQFEGGLAVTSQIVRGILSLGDQQEKALLKQDQLEKFTAYFLSRKYVYSLREIHHLTTGLSALANNKQQVPAVVSVYNSNIITKDNPLLKVRVTDVMDNSIKVLKVNVKSFTTADESTTLFDNKPFVKSPEKDDYIIIEGEVARGYIAANSFGVDVMAVNPSRGLFKCSVGVVVDGKDNKYALKKQYTVDVKVLSRIVVENVAISTGDKDQNVQKSSSSLKFPDKLSRQLEVDSHQKVVMTFDLKDLHSGDLVTAHQTFIRLVHTDSGREIFFVSEPDSDDHYKFTLDVGATAKDSFNNLSGKYKMSLIVGDATMQVPISWVLGDILITFVGEPKKSKRQEREVAPKPVIEHMFRVPEPRPPKVVSTAFTILVLSPLLVMFAMWFKIGANISKLNFSLSTLLFHVGLACVFVLYYMFWIQFDMFKTLKLLSVVGGLTFLGGNRMLAEIAANKYNRG